MKSLLWIITLPFTLVVVIFAIANLDMVSIDLWPFPRQVEVPLSVIVLLSLLVGFFLGGTIAWLSAGSYRLQARRAKRRLRELEEENQRLRPVRPSHVQSSPGPSSPSQGTASQGQQVPARRSLPAA